MNVTLVPWTEENKKDLVRICNGVDRTFLSNRLPYPYTEECADWWYKNVVCLDGKRGVFRAISVDGRIVGNVTVEPKEDIYQKDTELGYLLETSAWSKGIMTKAVENICELAFQQLEIERITAYVCIENIASQRVLLKNGFSLEGTMRKAVYKNEIVSDLLIFGKCR